jgi:hypothetical protein
MGKTNAAKVLGTFRNNYEDRKKSMMKSYDILPKAQSGSLVSNVGTGKCATGSKSSNGRCSTNSGGIGGNGKFKRKLKNTVENFGDKLDNLSEKAKYALAGTTAAAAFAIQQGIKRAKRRNG